MFKATIVVSFNNEYALTENFFENILSITNFDIEIIGIVDGIPDTKTYNYLEKLKIHIQNLQIIFLEENVGYSKANNMAAFQSHSDYLIFLNSDTFPIGDAVYQMIDYMDQNKDVGVAQGLILYPQTNKVQSAGHIFGFYKTTHAFDGRNIKTPIINRISERQALGSGFYITRKHLFVSEGGFDELYYNAWEGLEYSLKIHLRGYKCMYLPHVCAYHVKGSGRNRLYRDETYQSGYFWSKWGNKIKADICDIYLLQMNQVEHKKQYLLINGSSIRTNVWQLLLCKLPLSFCGYYSIPKAIGRNTVSLEDSIPLSFLQSYTQLLFVVDHFSDIINNYRTFQIRKSYGLEDMILDTHGNVIYLSDPRA